VLQYYIPSEERKKHLTNYTEQNLSSEADNFPAIQ